VETKRLTGLGTTWRKDLRVNVEFNVEFNVATLPLGAPNCPALGLWLM
jgi:hypothetical protein